MKKLLLFVFLTIFVSTAFGQRNGYSTLVFSDGTKFEGYWVNDVINGTGIYYWSTSHYYVGHWVNGKRWGYGLEVFSDGHFQLRYFENDVLKTRKISKVEILDTGVGIYRGEMMNNQACGKGTFRWHDGLWFEGTWTSDGKSRYGVLYYKNSQAPWKIGNWTDEKFDGYGCIISESGNLTVGFWQNGNYLYRTKF